MDATSPGSRGWRDLRDLLTRRPTGSQALIALLCGLLAFGLVTQVHQTAAAGGLTGASTEDLVGLLTDLDNRSDRLRQQISALQQEQDQLEAGSSDAAALSAAQARLRALGILAGTVPDTGPGIVLTINDPQGTVHADVVLGAVEELRDAGAQALQIGDVRIVASTAVVDASGGGIVVGGTPMAPPYRIRAVGDPTTLATALRIPGGLVDSVGTYAGASADIASSQRVAVTALHAVSGAG